MATKQTLRQWVIEALGDIDRPATVVEVAEHVWEHHEGDLRSSGELFYTWQYDIRWAAQSLRDEGKLAPVKRGAASRWSLSQT